MKKRKGSYAPGKERGAAFILLRKKRTVGQLAGKRNIQTVQKSFLPGRGSHCFRKGNSSAKAAVMVGGKKKVFSLEKKGEDREVPVWLMTGDWGHFTSRA